MPNNKKTFSQLVVDYDCLFFDAYGVLNGAQGIFPWVEKTFKHLHGLKKPFYIVSNDSSNPLPELAAKYRGLVPQERIISSGLVAQSVLRGQGVQAAQVVYFGEERSTVYLDGVAEKLVPLAEADVNQSYDFFALLGCGLEDWRAGLDIATNLIRANPKMRLLCPNPDLIYFFGEGKVGVAAGALAALLEKTTDRSFEYFGKPHKEIFEFAMACAKRELANLSWNRCLMIGDNLATDIRGAHGLGMSSALVLTGNTKIDHLTAEISASGVTPNYILESVALD